MSVSRTHKLGIQSLVATESKKKLTFKQIKQSFTNGKTLTPDEVKTAITKLEKRATKIEKLKNMFKENVGEKNDDDAIGLKVVKGAGAVVSIASGVLITKALIGILGVASGVCGIIAACVIGVICLSLAVLVQNIVENKQKEALQMLDTLRNPNK